MSFEHINCLMHYVGAICKKPHNELHFTRHLLPLTHNQKRPVDEIVTIIAAIMAHGCNIGPETMSQLTAGVTYEQIRRITEWQLIEENQRSALADVVNAIASLETSQNWGGLGGC